MMKMKMKKLVLIVAMVLGLAFQAEAGELTFSWLPNTETDLAGYRIYWGPEYGTWDGMTDVGLVQPNGDNQCLVTIEVPDGPRYFAATAYDTEGNESEKTTGTVHGDPVPAGVTQFLVVSASVTTTQTATFNFAPKD